VAKHERSKAEQATRDKWWKAGHSLSGRATTKPENQGLDDRARQGIEAENSKAYGGMTRSLIKHRHENKARD
jgi:hypothetical protein